MAWHVGAYMFLSQDLSACIHTCALYVFICVCLKHSPRDPPMALPHSSGHTLHQWLRPLLGHWQTTHRSCRRDFLMCPCDRWFTLNCSQPSSQTSSSCLSASLLAYIEAEIFLFVPPSCKGSAVEWISPHRNFSLFGCSLWKHLYPVTSRAYGEGILKTH